MMFLPGQVTVVIPTIPPRRERLSVALESVWSQLRPADAVTVVTDRDHSGAAKTRNRGLETVRTEWVAFLDDDDELFPDHLCCLMEHAEDTKADLVYPWFELSVGNRHDPLKAEGREFDAAALRTRNYVPVTVLARTDLLLSVGGFVPLGPETNPCEDHGGWLRLLDAGAVFSHVPMRTWRWNWWGGNTSGSGLRW